MKPMLFGKPWNLFYSNIVGRSVKLACFWLNLFKSHLWSLKPDQIIKDVPREYKKLFRTVFLKIPPSKCLCKDSLEMLERKVRNVSFREILSTY